MVLRQLDLKEPVPVKEGFVPLIQAKLQMAKLALLGLKESRILIVTTPTIIVLVVAAAAEVLGRVVAVPAAKPRQLITPPLLSPKRFGLITKATFKLPARISAQAAAGLNAGSFTA